MTTRSRAYRATHEAGQAFTAALPQYHEVVAKAGGLTGGVDPASVVEAAKRVGLPAATVRGAMASFDDTRVSAKAMRVCAGTSCMMAGGGEVARELAKDHACHGVYCLGYCDRSPAAMTAGGRVMTGLTAATARARGMNGTETEPGPACVRNVARHAVATARLMGEQTDVGEVPAYAGLKVALGMAPMAVVEMIEVSGLRGRGGAAFPTGRKWRSAAVAHGEVKFVVANGDEGDPGSFVDRELMENDPHGILEGMAICAHAVGASRGIVFIRSEYPAASERMEQAIDAAREAGVIGREALGAGKAFDVEVVRGMGSYVCGEETALLAAIEGQRGEVWPRPPFPTQAGVFGQPTVVDNVETLVNASWILERGVAAYQEMGTAESKGTKALCFNAGFAKPGIVEVEFGVSLREAIRDLGGGGVNGVELEAVLLGGPMGSIVTPDQWDAPVCFVGMAKRGINLGHGGMVALPRGTDWGAVLRHLLTFMRDESCGKCVPCRLGTSRAHEMAKAGLAEGNIHQFKRIMGLMKDASLCAFGRETPGPVVTILEKFGDRVMTGGSR